MQIFAKFIFVCVLYYAITSAVSYFRKKRQAEELEEFHRKNKETEVKKENDEQKPSA